MATLANITKSPFSGYSPKKTRIASKLNRSRLLSVCKATGSDKSQIEDLNYMNKLQESVDKTVKRLVRWQNNQQPRNAPSLDSDCPRPSIEDLSEADRWLTWALAGYEPKKHVLSEKFNLSEDDVRISLFNTPYRPVYFTAIDHSMKAVILCVRGTMSSRDFVTDAAGLSICFKKGFAHRGMLRSAVNILRKEERYLKNTMDNLRDYKLVLTGHSLGAGVASLITIMLKSKETTFSERISCWGYGCPPVVTRDIAEESADFIKTVVHQDDVVCRINVHSLLDLLRDIRKSKKAVGGKTMEDSSLQVIGNELLPSLNERSKSSSKRLVDMTNIQKIINPVEIKFRLAMEKWKNIEEIIEMKRKWEDYSSSLGKLVSPMVKYLEDYKQKKITENDKLVEILEELIEKCKAVVNVEALSDAMDVFKTTLKNMEEGNIDEKEIGNLISLLYEDIDGEESLSQPIIQAFIQLEILQNEYEGTERKKMNVGVDNLLYDVPIYALSARESFSDGTLLKNIGRKMKIMDTPKLEENEESTILTLSGLELTEKGKTLNDEKKERDDVTRLFIPGELIYLQRQQLASFSATKENDDYFAIMGVYQKMFRDIKISPTMISDHDGNRYCEAFSKCHIK